MKPERKTGRDRLRKERVDTQNGCGRSFAQMGVKAELANRNATNEGLRLKHHSERLDPDRERGLIDKSRPCP
jgi:hypothetical protein